eukprot:TRINITY_DN5520_c0_g2_i1.p1 TRINITY_DN5520_c0_g2~~TRINITY_DN5520_c0_g2_i1.p1  ORF type:complete len:604 (+),score=110.08 TRINITY_DN5520_c0_g2_i1:183-1814(+)
MALPSAILATVVKYLVTRDLFDLEAFDVLLQGNVYGGFTFVLGFSLVFRSSASYNRYWTAATSAHEMGSEWSDACASLIAFAQVSKRSAVEVATFTHTVLRLFSMLHGMSMEEIATLEDENFPLLDVKGFHADDLKAITSTNSQGQRMRIILCWIKVYIIQSMDSGLIDVPPPILTRVFQELGLGLVNYHKAQQVVIWPFPYPYTQLNFVLLVAYLLFTPIVVCTSQSPAWFCGIFTLCSCSCMVGLDLISVELENPFGDDNNDLPCFEMQAHLNDDLIILLDPATWKVPTMVTDCDTSHADLWNVNETSRLSLEQYHHKSKSMMRSGSTMLKQTKKSEKAHKAKEWAKLDDPAKNLHSMEAMRRSASFAELEPKLAPGAASGSVGVSTPAKYEALSSSVSPEKSVSVRLQDQSERQKPGPDFLQELSSTLQEHLDKQFMHLAKFQQDHLKALEGLLSTTAAASARPAVGGLSSPRPFGGAHAAARMAPIPAALGSATLRDDAARAGVEVPPCCGTMARSTWTSSTAAPRGPTAGMAAEPQVR